MCIFVCTQPAVSNKFKKTFEGIPGALLIYHRCRHSPGAIKVKFPSIKSVSYKQAGRSKHVNKNRYLATSSLVTSSLAINGGFHN